MRRLILTACVAALAATGAACHESTTSDRIASPIVGAWYVRIPEAPFQHHLFLFHSDGTFEQTNPDAGDPGTSDSNGMGVWVQKGDVIKGRFVEITADRTSRQFVSRGDISFEIALAGDAFKGAANASFYDGEGRRVSGPLAATLTGERVVP